MPYKTRQDWKVFQLLLLPLSLGDHAVNYAMELVGIVYLQPGGLAVLQILHEVLGLSFVVGQGPLLFDDLSNAAQQLLAYLVFVGCGVVCDDNHALAHRVEARRQTGAEAVQTVCSKIQSQRLRVVYRRS